MGALLIFVGAQRTIVGAHLIIAGGGSKNSVSQAAEIIMGKSVLKRERLTKKLARRMIDSISPISNTTFHR